MLILFVDMSIWYNLVKFHKYFTNYNTIINDVVIATNDTINNW